MVQRPRPLGQSVPHRRREAAAGDPDAPDHHTSEAASRQAPAGSMSMQPRPPLPLPHLPFPTSHNRQVSNWLRNERKRVWLPLKRKALLSALIAGKDVALSSSIGPRAAATTAYKEHMSALSAAHAAEQGSESAETMPQAAIPGGGGGGGDGGPGGAGFEVFAEDDGEDGGDEEDGGIVVPAGGGSAAPHDVYSSDAIMALASLADSGGGEGGAHAGTGRR